MDMDMDMDTLIGDLLCDPDTGIAVSKSEGLALCVAFDAVAFHAEGMWHVGAGAAQLSEAWAIYRAAETGRAVGLYVVSREDGYHCMGWAFPPTPGTIEEG